jgi:hypothetical protein
LIVVALQKIQEKRPHFVNDEQRLAPVLRQLRRKLDGVPPERCPFLSGKRLGSRSSIIHFSLWHSRLPLWAPSPP